MSNNPYLSLSSFTFATNILPKLHVLFLQSSNLIEIPHFLQTVIYLERLDISKHYEIKEIIQQVLLQKKKKKKKWR